MHNTIQRNPLTLSTSSPRGISVIKNSFIIICAESYDLISIRTVTVMYIVFILDMYTSESQSLLLRRSNGTEFVCINGPALILVIVCHEALSGILVKLKHTHTYIQLNYAQTYLNDILTPTVPLGGPN